MVAIRCFNPHPALRPGATGRYFPHLYAVQVSILTRPCDRVQRANTRSVIRIPIWFQSSPGLATGCNGTLHNDEAFWVNGFQSSPGLATGCNEVPDHFYRGHALFQSSPGLATGCNSNKEGQVEVGIGFQSSPGLATGCNPTWMDGVPPRLMFQSSPGLATGCNGVPAAADGRTGSFNPHPALRPGATLTQIADGNYPIEVSILTRPCDRVQLNFRFLADDVLLFQSSPGLATGCNPDMLLICHVDKHVSILTRPCDRVQLSIMRMIRPSDGFQSSPGLATGCNTVSRSRLLPVHLFQSSPGLATGCNISFCFPCLHEF